MPDREQLSDRWTPEALDRFANAIWPLDDLSPNGREELRRDVANGLEAALDELGYLKQVDRLRAELEALKANESAGVMCDACGISLNTARAGNAIEAAGEHGGHVMCGACRSAAKLQAENERLREAFVELLEEARDMRSYVPEHFAKKWKHDEALEAARLALASTTKNLTEETT